MGVDEMEGNLNADGFAVRQTQAFSDVASHAPACGEGYATIKKRQEYLGQTGFDGSFFEKSIVA